MKENNKNKNIAEYIMSGEAGPGIKGQVESVLSEVYNPNFTKEELDDAIKGMYEMYEMYEMYAKEARSREVQLFGIELEDAVLKDYTKANIDEDN